MAWKMIFLLSNEIVMPRRSTSRKTKSNFCNAPAVNIQEDEKQFLLEFAVPGMKKDDFKINLENQLLTISSEMKEENEETDKNYTRREFACNSFSRSFTLPKNIVAEKINADYKDGILNISIPKDEKTKLTREIKVA